MFNKLFGHNSTHPDFPELPLGMRINGLVKFKPSSETYFLLHDGYIQTKLPTTTPMIKAVSECNLFGMNIYRAYFDCDGLESILQVNADDKSILDVILFNKKWEFVIENDTFEQKSWRSMIGWKDLQPPDSPLYYRDWSTPIEEFGDMVNPLRFYEKYFINKENMIEITNEAMLYVRQIKNGGEDDIEYLLASFRTGIRKFRVEVWTGLVVGVGGIDIY